MNRLSVFAAVLVALFSTVTASAQEAFFSEAAAKCYKMNQDISFAKDGFEIWIPNGGKAMACITSHGVFIEFNRWEAMQDTINFLTLVPTPIPIQTIYGGAIFEGAEIVSHERMGTSHFGFANVLNNDDTVDICRKSTSFQLIELLCGSCRELQITQDYYPIPNPIEDYQFDSSQTPSIAPVETTSSSPRPRFYPIVQEVLLGALFQKPGGQEPTAKPLTSETPATKPSTPWSFHGVRLTISRFSFSLREATETVVSFLKVTSAHRPMR